MGGQTFVLEGNEKADESARKLKETFHDRSFMAHKGMWHLMAQRIKDARKGEADESMSVAGM